MNEMFEAGGDYAGRIAESGIIHDSADAFVFGCGEDGRCSALVGANAVSVQYGNPAPRLQELLHSFFTQ